MTTTATWVTDGIGMLGTAMVVLAYCLLQLERINPRGLPYNLINLAGASCLLLSLCFSFNLASVVIEVFWIAASLVGLFRYWRRGINNGSAPY
jgi:hypothetical protein